MDNTSYFDDQCVQVDGQPQPLKCITYNCQYPPKKYNAVADLSPDIIFLQSTCLQSMNNKKEFWLETTGKFIWIHSAASERKTKFTNKSSGCSIGLSKKKFKKHHVKQVLFTPSKIKGRGLFAKVKNGKFHLALFSLYPNLEKAAADTQACKMVTEWCTEIVSEQSGRSEIFGGMDANCRFTVCPDDYDEEGVVGPAGAEWNKQSRHAPIVQKMLTEIGCYLPSTFHGCGDFATYYWYGKVAGEDSPNVDGSRVDFLFVKNKTRIVNGCVLRNNEEQWFQQVR